MEGSVKISSSSSFSLSVSGHPIQTSGAFLCVGLEIEGL